MLDISGLSNLQGKDDGESSWVRGASQESESLICSMLIAKIIIKKLRNIYCLLQFIFSVVVD